MSHVKRKRTRCRFVDDEAEDSGEDEGPHSASDAEGSSMQSAEGLDFINDDPAASRSHASSTSQPASLSPLPLRPFARGDLPASQILPDTPGAEDASSDSPNSIQSFVVSSSPEEGSSGVSAVSLCSETGSTVDNAVADGMEPIRMQGCSEEPQLDTPPDTEEDQASQTWEEPAAEEEVHHDAIASSSSPSSLSVTATVDAQHLSEQGEDGLPIYHNPVVHAQSRPTPTPAAVHHYQCCRRCGKQLTDTVWCCCPRCGTRKESNKTRCQRCFLRLTKE